MPKKRNRSRMSPLHIAGHKSKSESKDYRKTTLMNKARRVFCAILNVRLCEWIGSARVLGEEENGFCMNRRAEDITFNGNELIERNKNDRNTVPGFPIY